MSQTWNGTKKETPERRTYTVDDIAQILGIGRTSAYILVKEGHFKIVRIGNAIRTVSYTHLTLPTKRLV